MRLVFAGTPETALPSMRALLASRHQVVGVVTRPDAPSGRGRTLTASPVAKLAVEHGLETLKPASPRDRDFLDRLTAIAPDCCPVVAYGGLLPDPALRVPPHGWVNLHFSLLPTWRGAAPVHHALMAGDDVTGATTFRIVKQLDAGPTYGLFTETIRPDDTAGTLLDRLARHGADLLVSTLDGIEDGTLEARPQPSDGVSVAPKLTRADARIDWTAPAHIVDRLVRGCTPTPGAWTTFAGVRLKIGPTKPRPDDPPSAPGVLSVAKRTVLVGTGTHPVELGDVQAPGKPSMPAADWGRGLHTVPARFGG